MEFIESKEIAHVKKFQNESSLTSKIRENPWIVSTIVLFILSALLVFGNVDSTTSPGLSENEAGEFLISFYEDHGITGLAVSSIEDVGDFYKVDLEVQEQVFPFYVTKEGVLTGNSIVSILPGEYEIMDLESYYSENIGNGTA